MNKKPNIQSLFKKWIVKRPKGMCQILFSLTELDGFCDEIKNEIIGLFINQHSITQIILILKQRHINTSSKKVSALLKKNNYKVENHGHNQTYAKRI